VPPPFTAGETTSYWLDKGNKSCKEVPNETENMTPRDIMLSMPSNLVIRNRARTGLEPDSSLAWLKKSIVYFKRRECKRLSIA